MENEYIKEIERLRRESRHLGNYISDLEGQLEELKTKDEYISGENTELKAELDKYRWIPVSERLPDFGVPVWCYCEIMGRFVGSYFRIGDTNWGNWMNDYTMEKGILPPTHWMKLPEPPSNKTPAGDD